MNGPIQKMESSNPSMCHPPLSYTKVFLEDRILIPPSWLVQLIMLKTCSSSLPKYRLFTSAVVLVGSVALFACSFPALPFANVRSVQRSVYGHPNIGRRPWPARDLPKWTLYHRRPNMMTDLHHSHSLFHLVATTVATTTVAPPQVSAQLPSDSGFRPRTATAKEELLDAGAQEGYWL